MSKSAKDWYAEGYDANIKNGDAKKAFPLYEMASKTDPNYANAYFGMASC